MLRAIGVSVKGPAHEAVGQPNQDAVGLWRHKGGWIATVADGLGSRPLSHIGSRAACQIARKMVTSAASLENPKSLISGIYRAWLSALPIPPAEAATTFLLAIAEVDGRATLAQIGDGLLMYRENGKFGILTEEREGFSNQTNAMGLSKAWTDWKSKQIKLEKPGDGIVLMTDGISDDLNWNALEGFFNKLFREFRGRGPMKSKQWIKAELDNWPTPNHSDDKTIAMIWIGK